MSPGRPPRGPRRGPLELLEDGTPVIIAPAPRFERGPGERFAAVRLAGLTVLELDRDAIVGRLLPRLEQRHFPAGTQPAFELTVRRQDRPADVVYRSPRTPSSARADARVELLDLRPEELSEEDLRAVMPGLAGERRPPPRGEGRGFVARMPRGRGRDMHPGGRWSLEVGYQGGSVDAIVEAARRRNLLVSFSVLLLLAAATALLASAAGRARRLAARQMEFVAAVSHELRTPVSVVCSAGENLADGVIESREAVLRYGALVRDEGRRLARLVEQVLDFAGTYTGKRPYRRERVAIEALVEQALAAAGPSLREAGFEVEADLAPELPHVMGDSAALARALRNLLENAVKYGGEDRVVVVRGRPEVRKGRTLVRLDVEDHGLGIPAGEQKHLFEPFWRGATATEREIRGSGLGLALVSSIVRAHGGEVSVKSEPGRGSVFTVALPAAEAAPEPIGATDERTHDIANPAG
jgi:signal transduction histidine kinase